MGRELIPEVLQILLVEILIWHCHVGHNDNVPKGSFQFIAAHFLLHHRKVALREALSVPPCQMLSVDR